MSSTTSKNQRLKELAEDIQWKLSELRDDMRWIIPDLQEKLGHWWYWNTDLEEVLIKLRLRKQFNFNLCYELIGGNTGDYVDSTNFGQPCELDLREFVNGLEYEDWTYSELERMPITTIEIANAFIAQKDHEDWMSRAMDPACSDY